MELTRAEALVFDFAPVGCPTSPPRHLLSSTEFSINLQRVRIYIFSRTRAPIFHVGRQSHTIITSGLSGNITNGTLFDTVSGSRVNSAKGTLLLGPDPHVVPLGFSRSFDGNFRARYATLGNTDFPVIYLPFT